MYRRIIGAGLFIGAIVLTLPAYAANCANRDTVVDRLQSRYSENFSGGGLQMRSSGQTFVEVWSSENTGTFTILLTTPEGMACVVATGTNWHQMVPEETAQGSAS